MFLLYMWNLKIDNKSLSFRSLKAISEYLGLPLKVIQSYYYKKSKLYKEYEILKRITITHDLPKRNGTIKEYKKTIITFD